MKSVSAIVVTYWTGPALRECLECLERDQRISEIIIVNNGNDRDTSAWLRDYAAEDGVRHLLEPGKNIGFSAGCNLGVNHSKGDYVAFVNPDCLIETDTIGKVLSIFKREKNAWVCGGRLVNLDGSEQRGSRRDVLTPWRAFVEVFRLDRFFPNHPYFSRLYTCNPEDEKKIFEVPTVSGAFMVLPRRRYEQLGGMDDNMFMHFEDTDLCIRAMQMGGRVLYCGNVPVRHYGSTSDVSKLFVEWNKARSSSYYFHKNFAATYPFWALSFMSVVLWTRFFCFAPIFIFRDFPGFLRRWHRGRAKT